jgi:hypothetical protein
VSPTSGIALPVSFSNHGFVLRVVHIRSVQSHHTLDVLIRGVFGKNREEFV